MTGESGSQGHTGWLQRFLGRDNHPVKICRSQLAPRRHQDENEDIK